MKLGINSQKARQERYFFLFLMMGVLFSLATIPVQAQPFTPSFPDSVQSQEQEVEAMTRAILQADSLRALSVGENIQDNFGEAGISLVIPTVYKSIQNDAETPSDQQPLT